MKYNFDEIIDRKNTNSVKWDLAENQEVLPMWVADMDFKTVPEITEALVNKISQGVFGYSITPPAFFEAIIDWWAINHQFNIKKEWILPGPGMIPTLSAIVRTFVKSGENIIIQPPVYNHFYTIGKNCQFGIVENNLIFQNGNYQIDYVDLEAKTSDPNTKLLLLCNPHNPVGKVWSKIELEKIAEICSRNKVIVVSDEIHADLVFEGHHHIAFASIAENHDLVSFTCGSPCKTFNLAGLPISYVVGNHAKYLNKIQKTLQIQETDYPNPIAVEALIAAYKNGKIWMEELKEYVYQNFLYLKNYIEEYLPDIKVITLEATYLVWLDCSLIKKTSQELSEILLEEEKLWLNSGTMYGAAGEGFLRINIGCPRIVLIEGLKRLENFYLKVQES
ncbi:MalY/PatB family protein [Chryseobacterium chendengshani]|uniref:MalY/PatB family protein n=1 Tax=unclassified Chryseobacterium TaxID=2593645 RepID=UPI001C643E2A|nr:MULTISPECIES: MalY/PatB family protein [unclassified Chryseobacterium]MBW7674297.1 pyridoxal phosphate-dependent aminotransferase [Chryseobacterium sp. LJ756]MBW8522913.1 pyridoxal phosphate-dependent aminotransferase [Chryseobacterium sp. LJ668]QYK16442.1 pyridoxal phosphate-dependent aminotransferase [Chryseobacterium sp. LJ668]